MRRRDCRGGAAACRLAFKRGADRRLAPRPARRVRRRDPRPSPARRSCRRRRRNAGPIAMPGAAITPVSASGRRGAALRLGAAASRHGQQLAHAAGDQVGDRLDGALGVRPGGADRDRRAVAERQPQHRHRRSAPKRCGRRRRRSRLIGVIARWRAWRSAPAGRAWRPCASGRRSARSAVGPACTSSRRRRPRGSSVISGAPIDHRRLPPARATMRNASPLVTITGVTRLRAVRASWSRSNATSASPAATRWPSATCGAKALAAQRHGVEPDVDQQHRPAVERERDRMAGGMRGDDRARGRRAQQAFDRIDRHAVAQHPFGKHRIGHRVQRRRPAGERAGDRRSSSARASAGRAPTTDRGRPG